METSTMNEELISELPEGMVSVCTLFTNNTNLK